MKLKIFTDGGARGNPGPAACAYVASDDAGNIRNMCGKYLGPATNNEAEYQGVIEALNWCQETKATEADFYLDSLLVVNQLNGLWKIKEARLRELLTKAQSLEAGVKVTYTHVTRDKNKQADLLVNETLDAQMR